MDVKKRLEPILAPFRFTAEMEIGDDGRVYGSLKEIPDIVGQGDTVAAFHEDVAGYLRAYAQQYADEVTTFVRAPNRQKHFPWVVHVLLQDDIRGVMSLIDLPPDQE